MTAHACEASCSCSLLLWQGLGRGIIRIAVTTDACESSCSLAV